MIVNQFTSCLYKYILSFPEIEKGVIVDLDLKRFSKANNKVKNYTNVGGIRRSPTQALASLEASSDKSSA